MATSCSANIPMRIHNSERKKWTLLYSEFSLVVFFPHAPSPLLLSKSNDLRAKWSLHLSGQFKQLSLMDT